MDNKIRNKLKRAARKRQAIDKEWYTVRSIFGNQWAFFFILLGAREKGKSYSTMREFIKDWKNHGKPFTWIRLKENATKKLLANNAADFVDADIRRDFDLELTVKGDTVFDHGQKMCKILALSTFYSQKGVALFDNEYNLGYNICLDEMNPEKGEKKTFDLGYSFVNQMENLVRSTKEKLRIVLIGNTTDDMSEILAMFNFIPREFGRYYLRSKKAVIDYMPLGEKYLKRRKGTVADILSPNDSTFTNKRNIDTTLVVKQRLIRPTGAIMFDDKNKFTIWDGKIIKVYNGEKVPFIPMRPYLNCPFIYDPEKKDAIFAMFDARAFRFRNLIDYQKFKNCLELQKPRAQG